VKALKDLDGTTWGSTKLKVSYALVKKNVCTIKQYKLKHFGNKGFSLLEASKKFF
jgi:hypothetical protein